MVILGDRAGANIAVRWVGGGPWGGAGANIAVRWVGGGPGGVEQGQILLSCLVHFGL